MKLASLIKSFSEDADNELADLLCLFDDLLEYFDGKQDAEYFTDSPSPVANEEMKFHMRITAILEEKTDGTNRR